MSIIFLVLGGGGVILGFGAGREGRFYFYGCEDFSEFRQEFFLYSHIWMRFFCLQLEASCLQWSFFTYS